jgi:hypothetical protein
MEQPVRQRAHADNSMKRLSKKLITLFFINIHSSCGYSNRAPNAHTLNILYYNILLQIRLPVKVFFHPPRAAFIRFGVLVTAR